MYPALLVILDQDARNGGWGGHARVRAEVGSVFECTVVVIRTNDRRDLGRDRAGRRGSGPCGFGHPARRDEEPRAFDFLTSKAGGAEGV